MNKRFGRTSLAQPNTEEIGSSLARARCARGILMMRCVDVSVDESERDVRVSVVVGKGSAVNTLGAATYVSSES